jgi:hypothetical protein
MLPPTRPSGVCIDSGTTQGDTAEGPRREAPIAEQSVPWHKHSG